MIIPFTVTNKFYDESACYYNRWVDVMIDQAALW